MNHSYTSDLDIGKEKISEPKNGITEYSNPSTYEERGPEESWLEGNVNIKPVIP